MKRIFISLNVPQTLNKELYKHIQSYFNQWEENIKPVDPTIYHCTLQFLGNIENKMVDDIVKTFENKKSQELHQFTCVVQGCGIFPHFFNPRVLWVAFAEHQLLYSLYRHIQDTIKEFSLPKVMKRGGFKPHVTLARIKKRFSSEQKEQLKAFLEEYATHSFGSYTIDHFSIMQSELSTQGPQYQQLAKIPV